MLPSQLCSRPPRHATRHGRPPYELLDALTSDEGRDRLIFGDYAYPYRKRLKAGITVILLLVNYEQCHAAAPSQQRIHGAAANRSRTVTGTCEAIAWRWAFGVRSVLATQMDIHSRPLLWLTDGVNPTYSLAPPFRYWPHVDG